MLLRLLCDSELRRGNEGIPARLLRLLFQINPETSKALPVRTPLTPVGSAKTARNKRRGLATSHHSVVSNRPDAKRDLALRTVQLRLLGPAPRLTSKIAVLVIACVQERPGSSSV